MTPPPFDAAKALAAYQPVPLTADLSGLSPADREVLPAQVPLEGDPAEPVGFERAHRDGGLGRLGLLALPGCFDPPFISLP